MQLLQLLLLKTPLKPGWGLQVPIYLHWVSQWTITEQCYHIGNRNWVIGPFISGSTSEVTLLPLVNRAAGEQRKGKYGKHRQSMGSLFRVAYKKVSSRMDFRGAPTM